MLVSQNAVEINKLDQSRDHKRFMELVGRFSQACDWSLPDCAATEERYIPHHRVYHSQNGDLHVIIQQLSSQHLSVLNSRSHQLIHWYFSHGSEKSHWCLCQTKNLCFANLGYQEKIPTCWGFSGAPMGIATLIGRFQNACASFWCNFFLCELRKCAENNEQRWKQLRRFYIVFRWMAGWCRHPVRITWWCFTMTWCLFVPKKFSANKMDKQKMCGDGRNSRRSKSQRHKRSWLGPWPITCGGGVCTPNIPSTCNRSWCRLMIPDHGSWIPPNTLIHDPPVLKSQHFKVLFFKCLHGLERSFWLGFIISTLADPEVLWHWPFNCAKIMNKNPRLLLALTARTSRTACQRISETVDIFGSKNTFF